MTFLLVGLTLGLAVLGAVLYLELMDHAETRRQLFTVMDLEQQERQRRQIAEAQLARVQHQSGGGFRPSLPASWLPPGIMLFLGDSALTPPQPRVYSLEDLEGEL